MMISASVAHYVHTYLGKLMKNKEKITDPSSAQRKTGEKKLGE